MGQLCVPGYNVYPVFLLGISLPPDQFRHFFFLTVNLKCLKNFHSLISYKIVPVRDLLHCTLYTGTRST